MSFLYKVTLFTATYNRGYILETLYRSVQRQTMRDFEWLIVDDGSSDDTEQLVKQWIKESNDFPIRYYKQENSGKCRAINKGMSLANGKLFFVVDSDDYLTDDALEKIVSWERHLPKGARYCGVAGNLGTSEKETTNTMFTGGFYDGSLLDRYSNVDGERAMAFYTTIHRRYPYPSFDGEKFMTEAIAYNRMAHDEYKMRFFNDIICIYEYLDDGLTKAGNAIFLKNPKGYGLWLREKAEFRGVSFKDKFRLWYSFYCEMSFCENQYRLSKKQCAEYIGAPLWSMHASAIIHTLIRLRKRIYK